MNEFVGSMIASRVASPSLEVKNLSSSLVGSVDEKSQAQDI
jgi:hypothetical protein